MEENKSYRPDPVVYVVDDEPYVLDVVRTFLMPEGLEVKTFSSGEAFLAEADISPHGCLVLDNMMPGMKGLDVQAEVLKRGSNIPILFISGASCYEDVVTAVREGALHFLQKPFTREDLLSHVNNALAESEQRQASAGDYEKCFTRVQNLMAREKQVYGLVTDGLTNKAIAQALGITSGTVESHRANMMGKLEATSLAGLMEIKRILGDS